jgi:hypothetical protein
MVREYASIAAGWAGLMRATAARKLVEGLPRESLATPVSAQPDIRRALRWAVRSRLAGGVAQQAKVKREPRSTFGRIVAFFCRRLLSHEAVLSSRETARERDRNDVRPTCGVSPPADGVSPSSSYIANGIR